MQRERALALVAGLSAAAVAAFSPPDPATPLRLATAALVAGACVVPIASTRSVRATAAVAGGLLVAAAVVAPQSTSLTLTVAWVLLAIAAIEWGTRGRVLESSGAVAVVAGVTAMMFLGVAALAPRLLEVRFPLLGAVFATLLLVPSLLVALHRHRKGPEEIQ